MVTRRRGLIRIGPAHAVRADALGLVRRVSTWDNPETLHVHPRTVRVFFEVIGFQLDVEGVVTAKLSSSDVSRAPRTPLADRLARTRGCTRRRR